MWRILRVYFIFLLAFVNVVISLPQPTRFSSQQPTVIYKRDTPPAFFKSAFEAFRLKYVQGTIFEEAQKAIVDLRTVADAEARARSLFNVRASIVEQVDTKAGYDAAEEKIVKQMARDSEKVKLGVINESEQDQLHIRQVTFSKQETTIDCAFTEEMSQGGTTSLESLEILGLNLIQAASKATRRPIILMLTIFVAGYLLGGFGKESGDEKIRNQILSSSASLSPQEITREKCEAIAAAVEEAEGQGQDQLSVQELDRALTAFEPLYHHAYALATKDQIKLISTSSVTNWGPPPPLPLIPYNPQSRPTEDYTRINDAYIKEQNMWNLKEFLRPLQLQHELIGEYENSINEAAFNYMQNSTDLPFAIGSQEFASAYLGFSVHVGTPTECAPYIRESKATVKLYARSRMHHAARKLELKLAAYRYFVDRSRAPKEIAPPAAEEEAYAIT